MLLGVVLLAVGGLTLAVPVEVDSFPVGIPVTCGGPYRLLTGRWLDSPPEGEARFTPALRAQWEDECRDRATVRAGAGLALVLCGGLLACWIGRRR